MSSKRIRKLLLLTIPLLALTFLGLTSCSIHPFGDSSAADRQASFFGGNNSFYGLSSSGNTAGTYWLASRMDVYNTTFDVFSDFGSGGNHFVVKAIVGDTNMTFREDDTNSPNSGDTAIKISFNAGASGVGFYSTGTGLDGVTPDTMVYTVHGEALPLLAIKSLASNFTNALKFADSNHQTTSSSQKYDYNTDKDGMWADGTAFIALAYLSKNNIAKGTNVINGLTNGNRGTLGSVYAASKDQLTTGFYDYTGTNMYFYKRESLAATSLAIIADKKLNPLWIGDVSNQSVYGTAVAGKPYGYDWLTNAMDQYHRVTYVYFDADAGGNHFDYRGWDFDGNTNGGIMQFNVIVDEQNTNTVASGTTSIKVNTICTQALTSQHFFGIFYLNGSLTGTNRNPSPNWGTIPNAGFDLTGATSLTFSAKGAVGGEKVKFVIFGVARNPDGTTNTNGGAYYPDSCTSLSTNITLTTTWTTYTINFSGSNIANVLNGFAYFEYFYTNTNYIYTDWGQIKTNRCNTNTNITIYVDNIFYNKVTTNQNRLIKSYYVTPNGLDFDKVMGNMANVYDNSLAALAFLATGDTNRSKMIVDSLIYAQTNDRYYSDNRLRNAYQSGDLTLPKGWAPNGKTNTVRMPGWWVNSHTNWFEDAYAVGSGIDANAWAMIAMLAYYEATGKTLPGYLDAAQKIANWIQNYMPDNRGAGGYKNGYYGWEPSATADLGKLVSANSVIYAAFSRLYNDTVNQVWSDRAAFAKTYIDSMWNASSGLYYMNGILVTGSNQTAATTNWGYTANAGFNLSGATKLDFYAKGAAGGEKVEFFVGGIGRTATGGTNAGVPYPDSMPKVSTGILTLNSSWTKYTINLTGQNLNYVIGGFGFNATTSSTNQVTFYVDDVKYDLNTTASNRFIPSYMVDQRQSTNTSQGSDKVLKNSAFIYDQAMSILSFLVVGENTRAKQIADALIYARTNDRYYTDGRLRNGYSSGDLVSWPGWKPNGKTGVVRLSGWWEYTNSMFTEDQYSVSTSTGNMAWVMLAMLAYYQKVGGQIYLDTAISMGDWVYNNTYSASGRPGFKGGFDGWEPSPTNIGYKSTEHNLDLYAAYTRLYQITGTAKWAQYATNAYIFVTNMWDSASNCFYTGTGSDGATIAKDVIPVDTQVWTHLSLRNLTGAYTNSFAFAEANHMIVSNYAGVTNWGYDFDRDKDGMWFEGTGQMATGYMLKGYETSAAKVVNAIHNIGQQADGGVIAASKDMLTTAFQVIPGVMWYYFKREAVGPTTWSVMADKRVNAFWIGTAYEDIPVAANTNTYGLFTETQAHSNTGYVFAKGGNLAFWNGCGAYDTNSSIEGTNCWTVSVWVTDWFGWGIYTAATNLSTFSSGFLSFKAKSWSALPIKVGIQSTGQQAWVNLSDYGFQTNNTWQTINVPMSAFVANNPSISFGAIEYEFMMFQASTPITNCNYYVDDIYWGYTY